MGRDQAREKTAAAKDQKIEIVRNMLKDKSSNEIAKDPRIKRLDSPTRKEFLAIAKRLEGEQS